MWIVKLALRLPYTFAVLALLILLLGVFTITRMATDIFPVINIPVVTVIWSYSGIDPSDMEKRFVNVTERAMTTTVNDIEHIQSESVSGVGIVKIFFQPDADLSQGIAQVTATAQLVLRTMPPGTQPPAIIRYDASDVPIIEASVSSPTESEASLNDYATNFIRTQLVTIHGAQVPLPYGGKSRQIMVDINSQELYAKGLSPLDVSNAISAQNLVVPSGDIKIGGRDYPVNVNGSAVTVDDLNNLPIKEVNGAMVYVHDVAQVRDGFAVQTNLVNRGNGRSVLLTVLKSGAASTLDVVDSVKQMLPGVLKTLPEDVQINLIDDQSVFVRASIQGVVTEACIAACLTATMILLFLGSLRSTAIVAVSIPLSILSSILVLGALGQTLNTMTLGGLALAVGILVDDTTVTIENINRYLGMGTPLRRAILDGAAEIATPALYSTLSICIVFLPVVLLSGIAKFLFVPLAESVVFAMLASYILSRTVTPTFAVILLSHEAGLYTEEDHGHGDKSRGSSNGSAPQDAKPSLGHEKDAENIARIKRGWVWRIHSRFNHHFDNFRNRYHDDLLWIMEHRVVGVVVFALFCAFSFCLFPFVGRDFFPTVDAGQIQLHVNAPPSTRIEDTAAIFADVEAEIRKEIPPDQIALVTDNVGLPSSINLAFGSSNSLGPADGDITIALKPNHSPTAGYVEKLRTNLNRIFPSDTFYFEPADIVSQILNFGLPAPIDVQIAGPPRNRAANFQVIEQLLSQVKGVPGAVDVHLNQVTGTPDINVNIDRERAQEVGLQQKDVADSLLVSLSSSGVAAPDFWLNPQNGVQYSVAVQTPQYFMSSPEQLLDIPITSSSQSSPQLLGNLATISHGTMDEVINHYNIQPVYDIYVSPQNRDLAGLDDDIQKIVNHAVPTLPRGSTLTIRGQVQDMNSSFTGLGFGLIGSVILVYLLLVVNYQSWIDPLVVISGVPGALSGIIWMLFITHTTFSVPALMGAIMTIGVSTANSVLLVTFANERRLEGKNAQDAAVDAGFTRLRPVLMTAFAMIIGMFPMALGLGDGGEQNAPLGRAVIGGLIVATFSTLLFVPIVYGALRKKQPEPIEDFDDDDYEAKPGSNGNGHRPQRNDKTPTQDGENTQRGTAQFG
jgi:multidrug efflux pump subunit AcrB